MLRRYDGGKADKTVVLLNRGSRRSPFSRFCAWGNTAAAFAVIMHKDKRRH